jgi:hypothetical protein
VIRSANKIFVAESSEILASNLLITDVQRWYLVTGSSSFETTVFDNCAVLSNTPNVSTNGALGQIGTELISCWFRNSAGPEAAVRAFAVGDISIEDTKIDNTVVGDAILVEGPAAPVYLKHVTGAGNAGLGVHVDDGGIVRVLDNATTITGTGGDMKVGTLVPRTWADFRANAPIKNEYDLTTPFVAATTGAMQPAGEELTGAGTGGRSGSRLFQR